MKNLVISALFLFAIVAPLAKAKEKNSYQEISFTTLNEHVKREKIENPFTSLSIGALKKLSAVASFRESQNPKIAQDKKSIEKINKLEQELANEGIDVNELLDIRKKMMEQFVYENQSTNSALNNKQVAIKGFILPIEWAGKKLVEFLLVPYVGACIHEPVPAANQIVYAKLSTPIETPELNLFTAVDVKGLLSSQQQSPRLSLVDGAKAIPTSYQLSVDNLEFLSSNNSN